MEIYDTAIIGGGILGLAAAMQLVKRSPHINIALFEKEPELALHQTSHNSGVIHSGIYYKPGSKKASNCIEGVKALLQFCETHQIPYQTCGKLIIATSLGEIPRLEELARRGVANGVKGLEMVCSERIKEIEPKAQGLKGLYSPYTSIVDFQKVAQEYAKIAVAKGMVLFLNAPVTDIKQKNKMLLIKAGSKEVQAKSLINCAGTYSDKIALMAGSQLKEGKIIPFRGEYYRLTERMSGVINSLIYPVPDPRFPFLGVHVSKTIQGHVEAGPNAIFALSREGYRFSDISLPDCYDFFSYQGFWKMALRYWKVGAYEFYRSLSKKAFANSIRRLIPEIEEKDLIPHMAGVRSQIVTPKGHLVDDFFILQEKNMIHVLNAPSPAATASIAIGSHIADIAQKQFVF